MLAAGHRGHRSCQEVLGTESSPTAPHTDGLVASTPEERQVLADAICAGARHLIATDGDDLAFDDLSTHGMSAVSPDYFMVPGFTEREEVLRSPLLSTSETCSGQGTREIRISPSIVMRGLISGVPP